MMWDWGVIKWNMNASISSDDNYNLLTCHTFCNLIKRLLELNFHCVTNWTEAITVNRHCIYPFYIQILKLMRAESKRTPVTDDSSKFKSFIDHKRYKFGHLF